MSEMIREQASKIEELEAELEEQCRLNGMGAEREAKLITQVENLHRELGNEKARGIHSCGPDCQRDGCVNRRLRETLRRAREALRNCEDVFDEVKGYPVTYDLIIETIMRIDKALQ